MSDNVIKPLPRNKEPNAAQPAPTQSSTAKPANATSATGTNNNPEPWQPHNQISDQEFVGGVRLRPVKALTMSIMSVLKRINEKYFSTKRASGPGPHYNNGYDDKDGHYIILKGEEILQRYTVQEQMGKGSFGTVARCFDEKRQETVALKITRNGSNFRSQAKLEIDVLLKLNNIATLRDLVVRILKVFDWQGHLVLVFELLSYNLYQLIKCTKYNGVSLDLVRKFGYQLLQVLQQLYIHDPPIIHCDIKPENILLKNQNRSGIRVIDFGSACYQTRRIFKYIQSRFYRSPEVILGIEYDTAIDRWSLGCVLVELHVGSPLFDGRSESQQLARMESILGPVPPEMVHRASKKDHFYDSELRLRESSTSRSSGSRTVSDIIGVNTNGPNGRRAGTAGHTRQDYTLFHDLVMKLLQYEPSKRIKPSEALEHPFFASIIEKQQQQQSEKDTATTSTAAPAESNPLLPHPPIADSK